MKKIGFTLLLVFMGLMVLTGCSECRVQVWANSNSDDANVGSSSSPHYVHVGETVQFRVYVQPDAASYVLMDFGGNMYMLPRVSPGEYGLTKKFDDSWRDRTCYITASAYRKLGRSDYMAEGTIVRKMDIENDPADQFLGSGSMSVVCYQSKVVIRIKAGNPEPDWSKASLRIFGLNNQVFTIPMGRPTSDGFVALGQDTWGYYNIFYEPSFNQIHRTGKTRAIFTYPDSNAKNEQTLELWFDTP
jgi:hypothetical protein